MATDGWNLPDLLRQPSRQPHRWVLLHHACPAHGPHFDWMFEPLRAEATLASARVRSDPASVAPGGHLELGKAPEHRRDYLTAPLEPWELSGGRGTVRRIAAGSWTAGDGLVTLHWDNSLAGQAWRAVPTPAGLTMERLT